MILATPKGAIDPLIKNLNVMTIWITDIEATSALPKPSYIRSLHT